MRKKVLLNKYSSLVMAALIYGQEDWVTEREFETNIAREVAGDAKDCRVIAIGIIAVCLHEELMVAGSVPGDGSLGFVAWDLTPAESLERIVRRWMPLPSEPVAYLPGEIAWFSNTDQADRLVAERDPRDDLLKW